MDRRMIPETARCRPHHVQCSAFHAGLVLDYTQERQRQEMDLEARSLGYETEARMITEEEGHLITFKEWIIQSAKLRGEPYP